MAKKSKVIYSFDGITKTEAQMRRSYNSYLKYRQVWRQKGYGLRATMSIEEYTKWHIAQSLMGGDPNIARTIARESLNYNATAAKGVAKLAQSIKVKKPRKRKPKKPIDIYDIHSTLKFNAELEDRSDEADYIREKIRDKYSNWRDVAASRDAEQVFLDLAAAEIDLDMWELPDAVRDDLYHDQLKRFREKFEADLYGTK